MLPQEQFQLSILTSDPGQPLLALQVLSKGWRHLWGCPWSGSQLLPRKLRRFPSSAELRRPLEVRGPELLARSCP